jgi:DNA repair protein SbcC/Rad50
MSKFRINKIEIDGFRGYSKPQTIEFNGKSTLITGGNYCGKSSTLGAIEWCLFGDFISVPKNASLLRKRDEFINDGKSEINVSLYLSDKDNNIKISRSKKRNVMQTDLVFVDYDNNQYRDEEAEKKLFNYIGLNLDDFVRSIYLHQESIRFLLTEEPQDRNTALDRLLGLETLTRILESVPKNKIQKEINSYSGRIEDIKNNLETRLRENSISINDAKERCIESGIKSNDLNMDFTNSLIDDINKSLSGVIKGYDISIEKNQKVKSSGQLKQVILQLNRSLNEIRSKLFDNEEIEGLNRKKRDFSNLLDDYKAINEDYVNDKKVLTSFKKEKGDLDKIQKKIDESNKKLKELENKRDELGSKQKLFQDALKYFEDFSVNECPICDSKIQQKIVLKDLKTKSEKYVSDELKNIDKLITEQNEIKDEYKSYSSELLELEEGFKTSSDELSDCLKLISDKLKKKVDMNSNIEEIISKKISDIDKEVEKLTSPLKKKDATLKENENKVRNLELLENYFKKKERQKMLEELQKKKELQDAESIILKLAKYQDMLDTITRCIQEVQVDSAEGMISKVSNRINEIYSTIVHHPYYSDLCIDVKPSLRRTGPKNNYFIKGVNSVEGTETLVAERFSTGHMNCVALAIYLAMAESGSLNHNLDFLILDDPSQNLDKVHMEGLATILSKIAQKSQIILSTQDPAFTPIMNEKFKDKSVMKLQLGEWNQKSGPKIECNRYRRD